MNYTNLSDEEVEYRLKKHDEADWSGRTGNEVIEPRDVLYWLDAFGDLSLAINCQGLPKDLPSDVVRKVNEYDMLNDWDGSVTEHDCPLCSRRLYEFGNGVGSWVVDEYGGSHDPELRILGDVAGQYWDSTGHHRFLCAVCQRDNAFGRYGEHWGVKVFYGDDTWYDFRHQNQVIAHDSMHSDRRDCSPKNLHDAHGDLVRPHEIERAFASPDWRDLDGMMANLGFTEITPDDISVTVSGVKKATRYAEEIMEGWATAPYVDARSETTHPDFDFPHFIEDGRHLYCPREERETVMHHLEDQVLMQGGTVEQVREHRGIV